MITFGRNRAVAAVLAGWLGVVLVLSGCSLGLFGEEQLSGGCGIAVDGSPSADAETGFDAGAETERTVEKFLFDAGCKQLVFAPISGASPMNRCNAEPMDLDPEISSGTDRVQVRASLRGQALAASLELLDCIRTDPPSVQGSDILGGLATLARSRPDGSDPYRLLVISDFAAWGPEGGMRNRDLSTPELRSQLIAEYAADGRLPDLSGAEVSTAGFGLLFSDDPRRFAGFEAFWNELMREHAGCASFGPVGTDGGGSAAGRPDR